MCQCQPKCVKCCKAATIYRSTLHVLHGSPQPQHSWPWEPRTPGTNSGSWVVTNGAATEKLVNRNISMLVRDVRNGSKMIIDQPGQDPFKPSVCKMDIPPDFNGQDPFYAAQTEDNYKGIIVAKDQQKPLMSLKLTREKKRRRNKTRKAKRKIAEDLRLLLDEKKKQK